MNIETHEVGKIQDWKIGLTKWEIYRINKNLFEINDFGKRWASVIVTKKTLLKLYNGEKSLLSLNWN